MLDASRLALVPSTGCDRELVEAHDLAPQRGRFALAGAKGGQGTTTVATVLAVLAAGHTPTTLLARRPDDVCALTATRPAAQPGGWIDLAPRLTLAPAEPSGSQPPAGATVADCGRIAHSGGAARHGSVATLGSFALLDGLAVVA